MFLADGFGENDRRQHIDVVQDFWEYNPSTDTWTKRAHYTPGEEAHKVARDAALMDNAGFLIVGCSEFWKYKKKEMNFPDPGDGPVIQPTNP